MWESEDSTLQTSRLHAALTACAFSIIGTAFSIPAHAQKLTVLASFGRGLAYPQTAFIQASDGSLYGATGGPDIFGEGWIYSITLTGTASPLVRYGRAVPRLLQSEDGFIYGEFPSTPTRAPGELFRMDLSG
ncbi:MAG TPA: choice-of-anchor tandem repeat GloVer-containing protein, partial [Chthonomonadales bacterium]|nr:choice-of-anchor tandem repeat GloVer-containing protein [Chthonomonadales bacterium]